VKFLLTLYLGEKELVWRFLFFVGLKIFSETNGPIGTKVIMTVHYVKDYKV
jgi:hypothetical protein